MNNPNNHNVDSSAHLRRTTYDLSHSKHMSGKIGELLPVMFQEINAGETFHWSPNFNFRFAPTSMPIQTRIKCVVDYFFVPLEAIWKDQASFFNQGMNNTIAPPEHPWLKMSKSTRNLGIGSVGDYLGIPSSISSKCSCVKNIYALNAHSDGSYINNLVTAWCPFLSDHQTDPSISRQSIVQNVSELFVDLNPYDEVSSSGTIRNNRLLGIIYDSNRHKSLFGISKTDTTGPSTRVSSTNNFPSFEDFISNGLQLNDCRFNSTSSANMFFVLGVKIDCPDYYRLGKCCYIDSYQQVIANSLTSNVHTWSITFTDVVKARLTSWYNSLNDIEKDNLAIGLFELQKVNTNALDCQLIPYPQKVVTSLGNSPASSYTPNILSVKDGENVDYSLSVKIPAIYPPYLSYRYSKHVLVPDDLASSPFIGNNPRIPLSPFGHRSYELCCNFFYRNKDIDALLDANGHRIVNQFLPDSMRGSGADTNIYPIHYALLEKDIFTSCFTEPLVNYNPLIGIRQKNNDIFYDFATSGGVVSMSASATGVGVTETGANHNQYTGAMITSYGEGIPQGDLNLFKDIIATGITNQDIYSAQCMQRWISNKVQKGYNFSEQQLAQFGVNSRWNPLTAPSYLGGTSEWINNGVVCNTAQSEEHALGELGGMPSCISNKENSFSYNAHDRGFIIGIMRIVPIPIYSQAIHKVFTKQKYTDYFIPEFDNKGYEAVPKGELVPYLAAAENKEKEAFGYQVPWYDYKSSFDTISGDMRVNFNDSVIMRDFGTLPELSRQFIECHPEDYNEVFVQTKQTDKFIGEIFHNIKAERVIGDYQSRVFANVH